MTELKRLQERIEGLKRALDQIVQIKLPELKRQVALLGLETLGYYALPRETRGPGDNERPIGPNYVRELHAQVPVIFNDCFEETDISEAKDRFAEILASGSRC